MATTSSIGTSSRNYSTIASWLAAFTTGGWIGECYNDSEFTAGCDFTGHSTNSSDYITLTTATGQSFKDNANAQTNALAYNQSNGVGVKTNSFGVRPFNIDEDYVTISNLQIQQAHVDGDLVVRNNNSSTTNCILQNLIMENSTTGASKASQMRRGLVRNCLLIVRSAANIPAWDNDFGAGTFVNCTVVRTSNYTATNTGFANSNSCTIKNCAVFGFTNFNTGSPSGSNNCSDVTIGFGTSNQASKTYANQFVTTTDSGRDFKVKNSSADLYDTGVTDTTNIPAAIDIVGTSRPQSTAWDIGAWELVASSPPATLHRLLLLGVS